MVSFIFISHVIKEINLKKWTMVLYAVSTNTRLPEDTVQHCSYINKTRKQVTKPYMHDVSTA